MNVAVVAVAGELAGPAGAVVVVAVELVVVDSGRTARTAGRTDCSTASSRLPRLQRSQPLVCLRGGEQ